MSAAATAARVTGVCITTHSHPASRNGLEQQQFFRAHGVPLDRPVIGHSGDTDDIDYLRELMDAGSTIGLDRFGMEFVLDDERRIATLLSLIQIGYADRIVIARRGLLQSRDASFVAVSSRAEVAHGQHHDQRAAKASIGRRTQEDIDQMMVANPRRLLTRSVAIGAACSLAGRVIVDDVPDDQVGPDDVQILVGGVGLCGSDASVFSGKWPTPSTPGSWATKRSGSCRRGRTGSRRAHR